MLPVNFEYPVEIAKAYEEEGRWIVEGYAATSDFDMQEDIITEEAIRASSRDLIENSTVLHNHNPDEAIGRVLDSKAKKGGLFLKILISKTVPDIWQQVKEGVLNKFSVRGKILDAKKEWVARLKKYARMILKMRLVEVSLVAVPANPKARAINWYVEKALDEFEKAGGRIEQEQGGNDMDDDVMVEEELLEASGEPELTGDLEPDKTQGKADGYPYPKPSGTGARWKQVIGLVDKLIAGEKDEGRKKVLMQIKQIASGALSSYPQPSAKAGDAGAGEGGQAAGPDAEAEVEKAGRKLSGPRLARLKKLLDELKTFVEEVDVAEEDNKADAGEGEQKKLAEIEGLVNKIAKVLGISDKTDADKTPALTKTVQDLTKRMDALEGAPGDRTSVDGQDELGEGKNSKSLWKGLV